MTAKNIYVYRKVDELLRELMLTIIGLRLIMVTIKTSA